MACLNLKLKIDGVDRTDLLIAETLNITQTNDGLNSTCTFDLLDQAVIREGIWTVEHTRVEDGDVITGYNTFFPQTKVVVCITNTAETLIYFAGTLARISATHMGQLEIIPGYTEPETQVLRCECQDFNQILEEMVIDDFREYGGILDEDLIDAVFDEFVFPFGNPIDYAAHVTAVPYVFDIITFDSITVRQFMDTICAQSGAVWYVDYEARLHYAANEAVLIPAWHLSDVPDDVNSFEYFDDITKEKDATNLVNRVFVVCGTDLLPVSLWFIDQVSIDAYGSHRAIVRDTSLIDIDDIEAKGNAILEKFKDPIVTYVLKTYKGTPGGGATTVIRAGQHIRVVCAFYDLDDTFLINNLVITFPVDGTPVYEITCGGLDSSASASARRSTVDRINVPSITPSSLPIAARGWGHDLEFSSPDDDTVAWTIGTITTADGQEFDIAPAADTGDMAAVTYVYLDTGLSLTSLQHSVNPEDSIGLGKILLAVCAPDAAVVPTSAMYQVFGGGAGVTAFLHADNIAANCLTANEIYGNTLSVIAADMGALTAGSITLHDALQGTVLLSPAGVGVWDVADNLRIHLSAIDGTFELTSAEDGNPRIEINSDEIAGYDGADVLQFELRAADGRAYAGAGAVRLNENGMQIVSDAAAGNPEKIRFQYDTAGVLDELGHVFADWAGGANPAITWLTSYRIAGDPWPANNQVVLAAIDTVAGGDVRLYLASSGVITIAGSTYVSANADVRIGGGLVVGSVAVDPAVGYCRIAKGLYVGGTGTEAADNDVWVVNDVRLGGGLYVGNIAGNAPIGDIYVTDDIRCGGGLYVGSIAGVPIDDDIYCDGEVSTDGGTTRYDWGGYNATGDVACSGYIDIQINGVARRVMCRT